MPARPTGPVRVPGRGRSLVIVHRSPGVERRSSRAAAAPSGRGRDAGGLPFL